MLHVGKILGESRSRSQSITDIFQSSKTDKILKWSGIVIVSYLPYLGARQINKKALKYMRKKRIDGEPLFFDPWRKVLTNDSWDEMGIELKEGTSKEIKTEIKKWEKEEKKKARQNEKDKQIEEEERLEKEKKAKEAKERGEDVKEETEGEKSDDKKEEKKEKEKTEEELEKEKNDRKQEKLKKKAKREKEEKEKAYKQRWMSVFPRYLRMVLPESFTLNAIGQSPLLYYVGGTALSFAGAFINTNAVKKQLEYAQMISRPGNTSKMIMYGAGVLLASQALDCWVSSLSDDIMGKGYQRFERTLKAKTFQALVQQEIAYFDKKKHDELMQLLNGDTSSVLSFFSRRVPSLITNAATITSKASFMWDHSPRVIIFTVASTFVFIEFERGMDLLNSWMWSDDDDDDENESNKPKDNSFETLKNFKTVRACAREDYELSLYSQFLDFKASTSLSAKKIAQVLIGPLFWFAWRSNYTFSLYYAATCAKSGEFAAQDLMPICDANRGVLFGVGWFFYQVEYFGDWIVAGSRVLELLDRKPLIERCGGIDSGEIRGEIVFKDVRFTYVEDVQGGDDNDDDEGGNDDGKEEEKEDPSMVINGCDLKIEAGQFVGLVGPSGSGKSTLLALVQRFYDPTAGTILLDGQPLTKYNPAFLAKNIGVVSQEPVVFDTTIEENIRYGNMDAPFSAVVQAAKMANLHDDIKRKVDEYQTKADELSGGQKQRLTIARALLKDPKILLLDEATSALDTKSERIVQKALANVMKGRTVIAIAHRLSTVMNADRIALIDGGKVRETGSHSELMKIEDGQYRSLVGQQVSVDTDNCNVEITNSMPLNLKLALGRVEAAFRSDPTNKVLEETLNDMRTAAAELKAEKGRIALLEQTFAREKKDLMAAYMEDKDHLKVTPKRSGGELAHVLKVKMTAVRAVQRLITAGKAMSHAQGKESTDTTGDDDDGDGPAETPSLLQAASCMEE